MTSQQFQVRVHLFEKLPHCAGHVGFLRYPY
jgi:hypothetical protein